MGAAAAAVSMRQVDRAGEMTAESKRRLTPSAEGRYGPPGTVFIDSEIANQLTHVTDLNLGVLPSAVTPKR